MQCQRGAGEAGAASFTQQLQGALGTGCIQLFSYVLAATFNTADLPGFELFSPDLSSVLTMQFMPVTVNGQTIYAPIQLGQSGAANQKH